MEERFLPSCARARVPVALAFIDYRRREVGVGGYIGMTEDVAADMARIAAFYADKKGRRQENAGPHPGSARSPDPGF